MDRQLSEEAVENLVTQFSSRLDFYRELVQNSIDAGTTSVDVWLEYQPGSGLEGVIEIHVDDFGEGMNEEIIDQQLTQLFASTKENDLTKIGKFGIGFVSVFAMKPKGVLIHTGRDGEYWEVFFHEDRSYNKGRLDVPVDGTQITLFIEGDRAAYDELVQGSRATLAKWCAHSDTEITFEDRSAEDGELEAVNQPFVVAGDCSAEVIHPGTEIALAFTRQPSYGYYNKGLALAVTNSADEALEGRATRFRQVGFKIKSRYLEHTLSRETVMRDDNYGKAMVLLEEAADLHLRPALLDALESICERPSWTLAEIARYRRLMSYLVSEPDNAFVSLAERKILRTLSGQAAALDVVTRSVEDHGRAYVADAASRLTKCLFEEGVPVFVSGGGAIDVDDSVAHVMVRFLAAQTRLGVVGFVRSALRFDPMEDARARVVHPAQVMIAVSLDSEIPVDEAELIRDASNLLDIVKLGYGSIAPGTLEGSVDSSRLFVLGRKLAPVMQVPPRGIYRRSLLERPHAVLNRHHPHFRWLVDVRRAQPQMAAYCLAKSLMLTEDRALDKDTELIASAQRMRT